MSDFFPTDVRVRIDGTQADGRALMGPARSLLFRALELQEKNGSDDIPVFVTHKVSDNAFISVQLVKGQKIVQITTTSGPIDQPLIPIPEPEIPVPEFSPGIVMLSGVVRGGSIVTVDGKNYLRDFAPSINCASAHAVPTGYHDNAKLAIDQYSGGTRASQYSGAMKRVVQYVLGLGKISDGNPKYWVTGVGGTQHPITLQYNYKWATTHGIYKAGDKNHWLIEISNTRGVLAMPLPLLKTIAPDGTIIPIADATDTAMQAAIAEFGGLPSGETFPIGTALAAAIANGTVLQLLMPGDLDAYYVTNSGLPHNGNFGWSFSESGSRAVHTNWYVKTWGTDRFPSCTGAYWQLNIALSLYDLTATLRGAAVGSGSASLSMLHEGRLHKSACAHLLVPGAGADEKLYPTPAYGAFNGCDAPSRSGPLYGFDQYSNLMHPWSERVGGTVVNIKGFARDSTGKLIWHDYRTLDHENNTWGCVVHAYFDGEELVRVRWVPDVIIKFNFSGGEQEVDHENGVGASYIGTWSPAAFITDSNDHRAVCNDLADLTTTSWQYSYTCALPAGCREGHAIVCWETGNIWPAYALTLLGRMVGLGQYSQRLVLDPSDADATTNIQGVIYHPTTYTPYFDASVNAGATGAWVITDIRSWATGVPYNLYLTANIPAGGGLMTAGKTTFIGGY